MEEEKLRSERSTGLFALGFIVLNFPILSLFDDGVVLFGIPALYLYLLVSWAVLIGLSFASLRKPHSGGAEPESDPRRRAG